MCVVQNMVHLVVCDRPLPAELSRMLCEVYRERHFLLKGAH